MSLNPFSLSPVSLSKEELAGHLADIEDLLVRAHSSLDSLEQPEYDERVAVLHALADRHHEVQQELRLHRPARRRQTRLAWCYLTSALCPDGGPMLDPCQSTLTSWERQIS